MNGSISDRYLMYRFFLMKWFKNEFISRIRIFVDEIQVRNYEDSGKKNFEDEISFRGKECDSPASPNKQKKMMKTPTGSLLLPTGS